MNINDFDMNCSLDNIKSDSTEEIDNDIAIIGIAAKTPLGEDIYEFWENIKKGFNFISDFPKDRKIDIDKYLNFKSKDTKGEHKYFKGAYFNEIDKFDYRYFNMTPKDAELMDPCQRMFLENTIKAIEDAGYGGERLKRTDTGIYIGYGGNIKDNYQNMIWNVEPKSIPLSFVGNMNGMMGSRISYLLDLRGPSLLIDTTCASSLVAIHSACQALLRGECCMAIAGSIRINLLPEDDDVSRMGVESKDYETRTFDNNADGFGVGEGVVSIVLKPLKRAIYDKDSIYAVIKGSAVNQGGNSMALTATNPEAQTDVVKRAWSIADIEPESIELIEAHGTGTNLGDPIEIKGITDAFNEFTDKKGFCAIGSVKSNLGHLYEASGIIGFLKIVLAIKNKVIPASLNFNNPNEEIDFINSPIYVNTKSKNWDTKWHKRRAAINSFGLNGANSHMVIEEYNEEANDVSINKKLSLTLSAKSESSLKNLCKEYIEFLCSNEINLLDMCYTAAIGRWHHNCRLVINFQSKEHLLMELNRILEEGLNVYQDDNIQYSMLSKDFEENTLEDCIENYSKEDINNKYLKGYKIDWERVYDNSENKLIHLPSYQFDKERCWLQIPEFYEEEFAYKLNWIEKEKGKEESFDSKTTLLLSTSMKEMELMELKFKEENTNCYKSLIGNKFSAIDENTFEISGSEEDFCSLVEELKGFRIQRAIYIADNNIYSKTETIDELDRNLDKGFFTIINLCKNIKLEELSLIATNLNLISNKEEFISKELSPIVALLKVVEKEDRDVSIKIIDKDLETTPNIIYKELLEKEDNYVAIRDNSRYVQVFSKVQHNEDSDIQLKNNGCYLVTGGTGSISLQICKILSQKDKISIVLLNRSEFVEKSKWNEIIKENNDAKLIEKIEILKEIERNGCKVYFKSVDICNSEKVKSLIEDLEENLGRINGVVHCAGIGDYGLVKETSIDAIKKVIDPKIKGTFIFDKLINHKLDFYILLSSVASVFPSTMQVAYCAANMYLDSFTDYLLNKGQKVLTINWTTWKEIGMAKDKEMVADLVFNALTTEEATGFLKKVLKDSSISRVLLGILNRSKLGINIIKNSGVTFDKNIELEIEGNTSKMERRVNNNTKVELIGKEDKNEEYTKIEKDIAKICKDILGYNVINIYENFFEMGADSLQIMNIHKEISQIYPDKLDVTDMFSYSNVSKLASFLAKKSEKKNVTQQLKNNTFEDEVAIIGVAAKLPKVNNLNEFYNFLMERQCAVGELPKWRKEFLEDYLRYKKIPLNNCKFATGTYLDDVDKFDYKFFNISPREASLTDPHQRLFLETVLTAIEDAGYGGSKLSNTKTGVFLGFASNIRDMYSRIIYEVNDKSQADAIVGNTQAIAAGRISYHLNLKGASMVVDTACSSSIVAIDTAINYLKSGSISMALVGGIKLNLVSTYSEDEVNGIGMESSDSITRSFDNTSDGTAFGEGVEAIVLKPLSKAIEDGDHIYASIKGVAINQDGNTAGITAPNPESQKEVILEAWRNARINPEDISYVEAHGTATQLGDRIEFKSLTEAFNEYTDKKAFCALGTVKTNYGHLSEGSGLFGLIKGLMSLKHESIPPIINFINPNSQIDMIKSSLYINTKPIEWRKNDKPRMFALSNFGMSGTNAHIVLQEYIDDRGVNKTSENQILTISNRTKNGLIKSTKELIEFLDENININLEGLSYTVNTGRGHYEYRIAIIDNDVKSIIKKLKIYLKDEVNSEGFYYGKNKVIYEDRERKNSFELYENDKRILTERANILIHENLNMEELCDLYISGADIDWNEVYLGKHILKVSAPTYKFDETRCWIEIPNMDELDKDSIFYNTKWIKKNLGNISVIDSKVYLIFYDKSDQLSNKFIDALEVNNTILKIDIDEIKYKLKNLDDYIQLLEQSKDKKIDSIINMLELGGLEEDELTQNMGLNSLFYLSKALVEVNYTNKMKLILLSKNVWEVTGEENEYNPSAASAIGLNRVIGLELSNVTCKAIDIDEYTDVEIIIQELLYETNNYMISYRKNIRYVEEFTQENLKNTNKEEYRVKSDGVYVLTGGTGGISLVLAKSLVDKEPNVKIALLNRNSLIDDGSHYNDKKIKAIEEIKAIGADVSLYKGDVNNERDVKEVFNKIKDKYGQINGVIHTAGVASAEILATKSKESFNEVINPKISGTNNIFNEIKSENVDFFLLCSSASTFTGEASQADYVAANTFLDAFTYYANKLGVKTHCINWVSWKTEGMAVKYKINVDNIFKALENKDAIRGFYNIINTNVKRILIGKLNFEYFTDVNINIKKLPFDIEEQIEKEIGTIKKDAVELEFIPMYTQKNSNVEINEMELTGKDDTKESYTNIELEVASIFLKVLGYKSIDIYDNFFELGGDSILLGRVHTALEEKFPGKIKLLDLFKYTTVYKISKFLTEGEDKEKEVVLDEKDEAKELESMLKELECGELSIDEMINRLN